jgi:UDP-N-acetylmuramoyl-L-alanyl-D-glutamate--2,6-diaminopimelate ligase
MNKVKLKELIQGLENEVKIVGDENFVCKDLAVNASAARPGSLFVALRGETVDGHRFIPSAIEQGAGAVLCEEVPSQASSAVTWIQCQSTKRLFPAIAKRFFGDPASRLKLIGVTGTNGKTTTTYLLEHLLGLKGGALLVGTVEYRLKNKKYPSGNTTPGILELTSLMREAVDAGLTHGIFEVSSHALKQGRLKGLRFSTVVFTNLTQDHLDYHKTFEDYFESKRKLFVENGPEHCLINQDDAYGKRLLQELNAPRPRTSHILTYSATGPADSWATDIRLNLNQTSFTWNYSSKKIPVVSSLICRHSVYNLLAALTAAAVTGLSPEETALRVQSFPGVPGRMERLGEKLPFSVFVDYAHSPDAFKNVLNSVRDLIPRGTAKILTVFGCGGDRDRGKRPLMGEIAQKYSDAVFLTSDNPRTENPESILDDIAKALKPPFHRNPERKEAIETALGLARAGDAVLILGKGHENYQIFGKEKVHFSDQEVVRQWAGA